MLINKHLTLICKNVFHGLLFFIIYIWSFFESVLFIGGLIGCIMLPVVWPMKFVYAVLLLVVFYICSKLVCVLEKYRDRKNKE